MRTQCRFYNTDTTDYWTFYPEKGNKINLTSMTAFLVAKDRLVSTKEIFDKLKENGIDGLEFYNCELDNKTNDVLQERIINNMSYIKLYSVKGNLFNYIPKNREKLEKLLLFNVHISEDFQNFLGNQKFKFLFIS